MSVLWLYKPFFILICHKEDVAISIWYKKLQRVSTVIKLIELYLGYSLLVLIKLINNFPCSVILFMNQHLAIKSCCCNNRVELWMCPWGKYYLSLMSLQFPDFFILTKRIDKEHWSLCLLYYCCLISIVIHMNILLLFCNF